VVAKSTARALGMLDFLEIFNGWDHERRRDRQDDLVSALIKAEEARDTLNQDELLAMVLLLLIAGHETTANLIGSGTLAS